MTAAAAGVLRALIEAAVPVPPPIVADASDIDSAAGQQSG
jgi:hypothetical protein